MRRKGEFSRMPLERGCPFQGAEGALPLFADSRLTPLVGRIYALAQAAEAHRAMEEGGGFGKVVPKVTE